MPSCSAPTNHCQAGTSVPNRECNKLVLGKSLSTTSPHPHLSFPKPASGARSKSLIMAIRSSCHGLPSTTAVPRFSTRKSKVTTLRLSATAHSSHEHPSSSSARSIKTVSGIPSKDENGTEISRTEPHRFLHLIRSNSYFRTNSNSVRNSKSERKWFRHFFDRFLLLIRNIPNSKFGLNQI